MHAQAGASAAARPARKRLDGLIRFYQIPVENRHRALGDAEATAHVLLRLLEEARRQYGIDTLEALLTFQQQRYPQYKNASPLVRLRETLLPRLPEAPVSICSGTSTGGFCMWARPATCRPACVST